MQVRLLLGPALLHRGKGHSYIEGQFPTHVQSPVFHGPIWGIQRSDGSGVIQTGLGHPSRVAARQTHLE